MTTTNAARTIAKLGATLATSLCLVASACSSDSSGANATTTAASAKLDTSRNTGPQTVRLGYLTNVTHAPAMVGIEQGLFAKELGSSKLEPHAFNAGPEEVEQFLSDDLDIGYIGPNPAINAWTKTTAEGGRIRIIAGSTAGGAALVVKPSIASAAQLKGTTLASPQLGGTQDVALRSWLTSKGLHADTSGGGDVSIKPQANADTLAAFKSGAIDGAWVPEPWATRLQQEAGGKVLVDEASLWPNGRFVTTTVIVRTAFLEQHADVVKKFLRGHLAALASISAEPAAARAATNSGIAKVVGKPLSDPVIEASFKHLTFTVDPLAAAFRKAANSAVEVGLLDKVDLRGIFDLRILNELLSADSKPKVTDQ